MTDLSCRAAILYTIASAYSLFPPLLPAVFICVIFIDVMLYNNQFRQIA